MKVVFDTNVIVDVLAKRMPFYDDALDAIVACDGYYLKSCITSNTVTDIAYILHRYNQTKEQITESLKKLFSLVEVLDVNSSDCTFAVESHVADFEDAVLAECAMRHEADFVVTRNPKDFTLAQIPSMTVTDFLANV